MAGIKRCSISDGIDGAGELGVALDGSGFNLHDALFNFALRPELSVKLSADVQAGGRGAEFRFLLQLAGQRRLDGVQKGEYMDQEEGQAAGFDRAAHQLEGNFPQA